MTVIVMGIDEAGRGSVIGPMIVSGVVVDENNLDYLKEMGVNDSKELTPEQREQLYNVVTWIAKWYGIVIVPPSLIDSFNLNKLTGLTAFHLVKRACSMYSISRITLDMVKGVTFPKIECGGKKLLISMEEKADSKYIEVAAASIVAKVVRDKIIEQIRRNYGLLGSGYPSDPRTLEWLKNNYKILPPDIVRKKWSTLLKLGIKQ